MPEKKKERSVRIVLVGDAKSGKTSIVIAFISETFQEGVISVVPPVTIPPAIGGEEGVTTFLVDTSSTKEKERETDNEIENADVICIVHPALSKVPLDQAVRTWTNRIKTVRKESNNTHWSQNVPVMVITSKNDEKQRTNDELDEDEAANLDQIIVDHPEVVNCIETSAKDLANISEIVSLAIQAVLYPPGPFVENGGALRERAFSRIFKICDKDGDGKLNNKELKNYQKHSFGGDLTEELQENIIEHLRNQSSEGSGLGYLVNNQVTYEGFKFIIEEFVRSGDYKNLWTCAKAFGYNDSLTIRKDYKFPSELENRSQLPSELSESAHQYLNEFVESYFVPKGGDGDGWIPAERVKNLIELPPLEDRVESFPDLGLEMDPEEKNYRFKSFRAAFDCMMKLNPKKTFSTLAYLGYGNDDNERPAAYVDRSSRKKGDNKKEVKKKVFEILLVGKKESGKSTLMSRLINYQNKENASVRAYTAVANQFRYQKEDYTLIVHNNVARADKVDLACFLVDPTDKDASLRDVKTNWEVFPKDRLPKTLVLITKADLVVARINELRREIEEKMKSRLGNHELIFVNLNTDSPVKYTAIQYNKSGALSQPLDLSKLFIARILKTEESFWQNGIFIGAAAAVVVGVGAFLVYRYLKNKQD